MLCNKIMPKHKTNFIGLIKNRSGLLDGSAGEMRLQMRDRVYVHA